MTMDDAALRAQQTPANLDRSRWEGCAYCADFNGWGPKDGRFRYCDFCGRPLTEDAWAELERRIGGNDGTTDI